MASLVEAAASRLGARGLHDALTPGQRLALRYCWPAWARPSVPLGPRQFSGQVPPPGDWFVALWLAGRGSGKTKGGGGWLYRKRKEIPGARLGLIGATADEVRKVMVFGESGLLSHCPPWDMPRFNVTDQSLDWSDGTRAFMLTADKPDIFRGYQFHAIWWDEPAKCRRHKDTYDNAVMGLRLGGQPQMLLTTTPRPLQLLRDLMKRESTVIMRGSTFDNAANLPPSFLAEMRAQFGGTTLGRQELDGELFAEMPGALWQRTWIEEARIHPENREPQRVLAQLERMLGEPVRRIVVGVDPAMTSNDESDECGISVAAMGRAPDKADPRDHAYILADGTLKASPDQWARAVAGLVQSWGADVVVAETTMGGETIPALIRFVDDRIRVIEKGGNKGKRTRAEPVAALYEQRRIHHVGMFADLEDQYCSFTLDTKKSPNNLDAAVYALGELMIHEVSSGFALVD